MCIVSGCPVYTPVDFLVFFPGNRNHLHFSTDVDCHELQLVCPCEVCHCDVEDEDALCRTVIEFFDPHSNRSFFYLRIADLVVDVAGVLDVTV